MSDTTRVMWRGNNGDICCTGMYLGFICDVWAWVSYMSIYLLYLNIDLRLKLYHVGNKGNVDTDMVRQDADMYWGMGGVCQMI